jgi:uncharacterized UPF0160 family protein
MSEIKNKAYTHGGKFHADDVFSAALLRLLNPSVSITRGFEVPEGFDGIVFDIGLGRFDHHQQDAEIRENGVPFAAFGLLWREFGRAVMRDYCAPEHADKEAANFDEKFIQPLDEDDNTGRGNQLATVIGLFNPSWDSDESTDKCFFEAVDFAGLILHKKFESVNSVQRATSLVEKALAASSDSIVLLPRYAPWKNVLVKAKADFVVYPSQRGGYSAQVVPADTDKDPNYYFPQAWAGKPEAELKRVSGIASLTFCHKGRFLISTGSLDDAMAACRLARIGKAKG